MKPALLRPQARLDRKAQVRYYRKEAGAKVAERTIAATRHALDQIELHPGMGSPLVGKTLGVPALRAWRVSQFPLLWFYFERDDHLDVVRLLGDRQDLVSILLSESDAHIDGQANECPGQTS